VKGGNGVQLAHTHGIRTEKPSPGRTVSGEMPALEGAKCYTETGDAPLALRTSGVGNRLRHGKLFLTVAWREKSAKSPDEGENGRQGARARKGQLQLAGMLNARKRSCDVLRASRTGVFQSEECVSRHKKSRAQLSTKGS